MLTHEKPSLFISWLMRDRYGDYRQWHNQGLTSSYASFNKLATLYLAVILFVPLLGIADLHCVLQHVKVWFGIFDKIASITDSHFTFMHL